MNNKAYAATALLAVFAFAAAIFIRLLEKFPRFEMSAYLLVIVIGLKLLGDWNWWMPRWLDWIPRVTIEGDPDVPVDAGEAASA